MKGISYFRASVQSSKQSAILVFAESVKVQAGSKTLHHSKEVNFHLLQNLTDDSLRKARKTGLDVYHFDECSQRGQTFATRLSNAIQDVFKHEYERLIVIGSDCPDLSSTDIINAESQLRKSDGMIVGPDLRGGIYLLGLSRSAYQREKFEKLSWQTKDLRKTFIAYAEEVVDDIVWLEKKADFNETLEIKKYWSVSKCMRSILNRAFDHITFFQPITNSYSFQVIGNVGRRGPPRLFI